MTEHQADAVQPGAGFSLPGRVIPLYPINLKNNPPLLADPERNAPGIIA
ncbi:hypothetical protein [Pseudomonas sp. Leaf48]|nr:hypothetical protein [Pseudomonas sp. Leaf48]